MTRAAMGRAQLQQRGSVIGALDMWIGAHAHSIGATLVTHNTREFSRIGGWRLAAWVTAWSAPSSPKQSPQTRRPLFVE